MHAQVKLVFKYNLQNRMWYARRDNVYAEIKRMTNGWFATLYVRQHKREGFFDNVRLAQSEMQELMNRLLFN